MYQNIPGITLIQKILVKSLTVDTNTTGAATTTYGFWLISLFFPNVTPS